MTLNPRWERCPAEGHTPINTDSASGNFDEARDPGIVSWSIAVFGVTVLAS